jgi:hypothetical protein
MVSKFEFQWMGGEVDLVLKIRLFIFPDVVFEEGYGDNKGDKFIVIVPDNFKKFLLFVRRELFLEITHHVLEDIGVLLGSGFQAQGLHEQEFIPGIDLGYLLSFGLSDQSPHFPVLFCAVGENE